MAPSWLYAVFHAILILLCVGALCQTPNFDEITKPAKDEKVPAGSTYTITWKPSPDYTGSITLSLLGGSSPSTLTDLGTIACGLFLLLFFGGPLRHCGLLTFYARSAGVDSSKGSYSWAVDGSLGKDGTYGIQITSDADKTVFQYSFPFQIAIGSAGGSAGEKSSTSAPNSASTVGSLSTTANLDTASKPISSTKPGSSTAAGTQPTNPTATSNSSGSGAQSASDSASTSAPSSSRTQDVNATKGSSASLSKGAIAGIAVGCAAVIAIIAVLVFYVLHYRRRALEGRDGGRTTGEMAELDGATKVVSTHEIDTASGGFPVSEMEVGSRPAELHSDIRPPVELDTTTRG